MSTTYPVYDRLSPAARHDGTPEEMWDALVSRAWAAQGDWVRLMRPDGLCVGMRVRESDMRREVYIEVPDDVAVAAELRARVETLWPHLFRAGWHRRFEERATGAALTFVALWPGEIAPGRRQ